MPRPRIDMRKIREVLRLALGEQLTDRLGRSWRRGADAGTRMGRRQAGDRAKQTVSHTAPCERLPDRAYRTTMH